MKLWIDDVRPAPNTTEYVVAPSVNIAKAMIEIHETQNCPFELIDIDHDAGDWAEFGGDYIRLLDWLEETGRNYSIHIHSMNPVGRQNMMAICQKNGWTVIM